EALVVDGEGEGSITLHGQRLTVRPDGRIRGHIEARHVILQGRGEGDIKGRLDIKKPEAALMIATKPRATAAIPVASTSQQGSLLEGAAEKSGKSWYK